ncbi:nucleoside-diphosphate-sugar epimerase [Sphingobium sp. OAS761]|uniref:NAD-dependent epimerase/dehydratase family protein n=1 Tax=Sphingobium sp. OAS761 TaxID=2817901 RepID=UPI00209C7D31|nr:NAD-dependent epimerase/dehydratase family protein [Sphingobium sp. OAS761]MCP1469761.1 nucleoside-diphosphate-sugar epimerase [Sphingobium sp. OAS761]
MKLIITGAAGVLGSATAALLERQGHEVVHIVRSAVSNQPRSIACDDLADADAAERSVGAAVEAPGSLDRVLHLAGAFDWRPVAQGNADL